MRLVLNTGPTDRVIPRLLVLTALKSRLVSSSVVTSASGHRSTKTMIGLGTPPLMCLTYLLKVSFCRVARLPTLGSCVVKVVEDMGSVSLRWLTGENWCDGFDCVVFLFGVCGLCVCVDCGVC